MSWTRRVHVYGGDMFGYVLMEVYWDNDLTRHIVTSKTIDLRRFIEWCENDDLNRQWKRMYNEHWEIIREKFD